MVKRKAPLKKPPAAPASKKAASKEEDTAESCIGCSSQYAYVQLPVNSEPHVLFSKPASKPAVACLTCAYHSSLVSQLRSALQDDLRRPVTSCLVCRSSGRLLQIHQVEGASDALLHPSVRAEHFTSQITSKRKLCTSCAYSLHWLYKQTIRNEDKFGKKTVTTRTVEIVARTSVKEKANPPASKKLKKVEPPPKLPAKRGRTPTAKAVEPTSSSVSRSSRNRTQPQVIELSDDSDEDDEIQEIKPEPKRRKIATKVEQSKPATSSRPTRTKAAPARPLPVRERKKVATKSTGKKTPTRRPARFKRASTPELVPYECTTCSKNFESTVEGRLHELEHNNRKFDLVLTRCKTPPGSLSPIPGSLSDDDDKKRKPRKSSSPKKNAAKNRVSNEDEDEHEDFIFHAPAVLQFPKDADKSSSDSIDFSFEKPLELKPNEEETQNDFSDDEEEESENVADCITSLETAEKSDEDLQETEKNDDKSDEKSDDKPEETEEIDTPIVSDGEEKKMNGTHESPVPKERLSTDSEDTEESPTKNSPNKTELSFDFFDEPIKKSPSKSLNSFSMDFEEPFSDKEKFSDKEIETPETATDPTIDTSNALRDDSTNPTLAEGQPESDGSFNTSMSSPPDSSVAPASDINQIEQMMAEVVADN